MASFARPRFEKLLKSYTSDPASVHACRSINPTKDGIHTSAARMSEALVIANGLARTRQDIARLGTGEGPGRDQLLGKLAFPSDGLLCPHGIARGAQDLGKLLENEWGPHPMGWQNLTTAPAEIQGRTGIVLFIKVQGVSGLSHIDLWDKTAIVGSAFWDAQAVWFWPLP